MDVTPPPYAIPRDLTIPELPDAAPRGSDSPLNPRRKIHANLHHERPVRMGRAARSRAGAHSRAVRFRQSRAPRRHHRRDRHLRRFREHPPLPSLAGETTGGVLMSATTTGTTHTINLRPPQEYLDAFYLAARQIYRSQANEVARREAIMITNCEKKP